MCDDDEMLKLRFLRLVGPPSHRSAWALGQKLPARSRCMSRYACGTTQSSHAKNGTYVLICVTRRQPECSSLLNSAVYVSGTWCTATVGASAYAYAVHWNESHHQEQQRWFHNTPPAEQRSEGVYMMNGDLMLTSLATTYRDYVLTHRTAHSVHCKPPHIRSE